MTVLLFSLGIALAEDVRPEADLAYTHEYRAVERTLPADAPRLAIRGSEAAVTIRQDANLTTSRVIITPVQWNPDCSVKFSGDLSLAIAEIQEFGERTEWGCTVEIDVILAGPTEVDIALRKGQIHAESMHGPLKIDMNAGQVSGTTAEADITVHRGKVRLWDLTSPVAVKVNVGRVNLTYTTEIAGTVVADVGWGRITARFPYGVLLDYDVNTRVGWLKSAIPSRKGESTVLQAATGLGTVHIHTDLAVLSPTLAEAR